MNGTNLNHTRLRRTNSVTRVSEIKDSEKKARKEQADQPYDHFIIIYIMTLLMI